MVTRVPDRQDIIWIDCNPQVGQEMRDVHPFLVLSPRLFNDKTSLVIGLPMSTAEYNADHPFAVAVGNAAGRKADKTSYVLCAINPSHSTGENATADRIHWVNSTMRCLTKCAKD